MNLNKMLLFSFTMLPTRCKCSKELFVFPGEGFVDKPGIEFLQSNTHCSNLLRHQACLALPGDRIDLQQIRLLFSSLYIKSIRTTPRQLKTSKTFRRAADLLGQLGRYFGGRDLLAFTMIFGLVIKKYLLYVFP